MLENSNYFSTPHQLSRHLQVLRPPKYVLDKWSRPLFPLSIISYPLVISTSSKRNISTTSLPFRLPLWPFASRQWLDLKGRAHCYCFCSPVRVFITRNRRLKLVATDKTITNVDEVALFELPCPFLFILCIAEDTHIQRFGLGCIFLSFLVHTSSLSRSFILCLAQRINTLGS